MKKTILFLAAASIGGLGFAAAGDRTIGDGNLPDFLAEFDVNGDGSIDEEERQAMRDARKTARDERRAQWDLDGDGEISDEERDAAREALRARIEERRSERFNAADTDGSGDLNYEEFTAIPAVARLAERHPDKAEAIYNRLDANEDGTISLEEFMAHLGHRRGHHRPRPGGDGPDGPGGGEEGGGEEGGGEEGGGEERPVRRR